VFGSHKEADGCEPEGQAQVRGVRVSQGSRPFLLYAGGVEGMFGKATVARQPCPQAMLLWQGSPVPRQELLRA